MALGIERTIPGPRAPMSVSSDVAATGLPVHDRYRLSLVILSGISLILVIKYYRGLLPSAANSRSLIFVAAQGLVPMIGLSNLASAGIPPQFVLVSGGLLLQNLHQRPIHCRPHHPWRRRTVPALIHRSS